MRRIYDRGCRVPEDFSIIGYDNISHSANSVPGLTTVSSGTSDEIASAMVSLLMNRLKNPQLPRQKILLKSELIERESVADLTK